MDIKATYLFPDDSLIDERQHMSRRMGQARKHHEPVSASIEQGEQ